MAKGTRGSSGRKTTETDSLCRIVSAFWHDADEREVRSALERAAAARHVRILVLRRAVRNQAYCVPAGLVAAAMLLEAQSACSPSLL